MTDDAHTASIFARCKPELLERLERKLAEVREREPGRKITKADLVREILYAGTEMGDGG